MGIKTTLVAVFVLIVAVNAKRSNATYVDKVFSGGEHLEGPHYAYDEGALYWVDITEQKYYRLEVNTGNVTSRKIGYGPNGLIIRVKDYPKLLLVTSRSEIFLVSWDAPQIDYSYRQLSAVDIGIPENRINDGKVDPRGRLWFGTMDSELIGEIKADQGSLYMLTDKNYKNPELKVRPVSVSNGIAWSANNKSMFYVDSLTRNIDVFDYDIETGAIGNRSVLFSYAANNITGVPDGMTIDSEDNLWAACFYGGLVIKVNSKTGQLLEQYKIPASQVSSVMWGGDDLSTLYVTTSTLLLTPEQRAQEPEAGSIFAIHNTGATGLPSKQFVFPNADKY